MLDTSIASLSEKHLAEVREYYDSAPAGLKAGARAYRRCLAQYLSLIHI